MNVATHPTKPHWELQPALHVGYALIYVKARKEVFQLSLTHIGIQFEELL